MAFHPSGSEAQTVPADLLRPTADLDSRIAGLRASLLGLDLVGPIDPSDPTNLAALAATINRQGAAIELTAGELDLLKLRLGTDGSGDDNDHDARLRVHEQRLNDQDATDDTQSDRLDDHDDRLRDQERTNAAQAQQLDTHDEKLDDHETRLNEHDRQIALNTRLVETMHADVLNQLAGMQDELRDHDKRIDTATAGVAMALAMKSPAVPDDKTFALSGSFGVFEGKTALAFSGGVRATDALQFDAGVAVGLDQGSIGGRAGATLAW